MAEPGVRFPLTVPVRLGDRSYNVVIGYRHLNRLIREIVRGRDPEIRSGAASSKLLSRDVPQSGASSSRSRWGTHPVVLSNRTILRGLAGVWVKALHRQGLPITLLTLADTERSKSVSALGRLLNRLADLDGPGRRLFLILLGGGVVGDLGGLAAGLYRRGIPYLQVPTTLLAQVDSAMGGKTGIDLPHGKNLAGLFYQPRLVFIDVAFLRTLSDRQFRSGLAEALKCGVIRDAALFTFLERVSVSDLRRSPRALGWVIWRAVRVKARMVEADERETRGLRTLLNFGHTVGHALEAATRYSKIITHGEAVALGMLAATEISRELGKIDRGSAARIGRLIRSLGFPIKIRGARLSAVLRAMSHDKKWSRGQAWVLPTGIGRAAVVSGVPENLVRRVLRSFLEG